MARRPASPFPPIYTHWAICKHRKGGRKTNHNQGQSARPYTESWCHIKCKSLKWERDENNRSYPDCTAQPVLSTTRSTAMARRMGIRPPYFESPILK